TFIPFDEYVIALSLYYVKYNLDIDSSKLSFDIHDAHYLHSVLKELNMKVDSIFIKEYKTLIKDESANFSDELVRFHYDLWQRDKVDLVITSINTVYEQLSKLGVNCFRMIIPQKNILDSLNIAYTRGELML